MNINNDPLIESYLEWAARVTETQKNTHDGYYVPDDDDDEIDDVEDIDFISDLPDYF